MARRLRTLPGMLRSALLLVVGCLACTEARTPARSAADPDAQAVVELSKSRDAARAVVALDDELARQKVTRAALATPPSDGTVAAWVAKARVSCGLELSTRACELAPDGATQAQREQCLTACRTAEIATVQSRLKAAEDECAGLPWDGACQLSLPATSTLRAEVYEQLVAQCSSSCAERRAAGTKAATR